MRPRSTAPLAGAAMLLAATSLAGVPAPSAADAAASTPVPPAGGRMELVAVGPDGVHGDDYSGDPSISASGRYVAFDSDSTNLVPVDANGDVTDVFLRDRKAKRTTLLSVSSRGVQGDDYSYVPMLANDGSAAAFMSDATNLVRGDTDGVTDVFVRNLAKGTTVLASLGNEGQRCDEACLLTAISDNGRYVAFATASSTLDARTGADHLNYFIRDRERDKTVLVTRGMGGVAADAPEESDDGEYDSFGTFSADARYLAYASGASNLVAGDSNGALDVFRYDMATKRSVLVSVASGGAATGDDQSNAPKISADGRLVAFYSRATNLLATPTTDGLDQAYVRDMDAGTTRMVTAPGGGAPNGYTYPTGISPDGRHLLLVSDATNLVAGVSDGNYHAFVYDMAARTFRVADMSASGALGDDDADNYIGDIAGDGTTVAFETDATNLVPGDVNDSDDAFVGTARAQVPGLAAARRATPPVARSARQMALAKPWTAAARAARR